MRVTSTRIVMDAAKNITLNVIWHADDDGHGWKGDGTVWRSGSERIAVGYKISLRQGQPLGSISIDLDECSSGAWMFYSFEGTGITERDLQWATVFAAAAIRHKRGVMGHDRI